MVGPLCTQRTRKILLVVYATLFALCVAVIAWMHQIDRKAQREQVMGQLASITSTMAAQLNADHVRMLLDQYDGRGMIFKSTQDARYYLLHDHLRRSAANNGFTGRLRVVTHDTRKQELQVVVTADQEPEYRMPYEGPGAEALTTRMTSGTLLSGRGDDERLLAHAPLITDKGVHVGHVVAEISVGEALVGTTGTLWRNMLLAVVVFGLAGLALMCFVGRWLQQNDAAMEDLARRHEGVTDSIAYAAKIQRSLVPPPQVYNELFDGSFVIDRPKDMVSGDFHWYHRTGPDTCFVAAADCTGHGLPGAMLSAIGCSLLNEVVSQHPDREPAELLTMLNIRLITTLHQRGVARGGGDGMDVALCYVDRKEHTILFAGAFRPLYWVHQGKLTVINGDRKPIGGAHQELDRKFTGHRLSYSPGDRIYLFSDGYVDQFGGPERKRFMASRLSALIGDIHDRPMNAQAEILERTFIAWKGSEEQIDDVCMLGLAV